MNVKLENQTILIVANEPWGNVWFSKHNYAWELAKRNNVLFINSPQKWKFKNLFINKISSSQIHKTLSIVSIENYLPSSFPILMELNNFINSKRVKRFVSKQNSKFILWSFTPLVFFRPKMLGCFLSIFHSVDMHWPKFYGTKIISEQADKLILISKEIEFEYTSVKKPKLIVPHGISPEAYELDDKKKKEVTKELEQYGKFGLFVGSIDDRLDFHFIEQLAIKFPATNFIFIGPINILKKKNHLVLFHGKHKNIIPLGTRPYRDIKYYINLAYFCISPMEIDYPGNNISHHKTIPYLAQGKAIFSPPFKEYNNFYNLMYMNYDNSVLLKLLDEFIKNGEDLFLRDKRIDFSKSYLYENNILKIEQFINE